MRPGESDVSETASPAQSAQNPEGNRMCQLRGGIDSADAGLCKRVEGENVPDADKVQAEGEPPYHVLQDELRDLRNEMIRAKQRPGPVEDDLMERFGPGALNRG